MNKNRVSSDSCSEIDKMRDVFEFLPDAAFVLDKDCRVTCWNRAAEIMTGVPKEKVLGLPDYSLPFYKKRRPILVDLLDSDDALIKSKYDYVRRAGDVIYAETFIPHFNDDRGAYIWIAASPLFDKEGKRTGAIEVVRDISERRRLLEDLHETEDLFRQLSENIQEVFFLIEKESRKILYVSPASKKILGLGPEEIIEAGGRLSDIVHPDDRDKCAFADINRRYSEEVDEEFRIIKPGGDAAWLRLRTFLIRDKNENVIRAAGVVSDITFHKQAEEKNRMHRQQLIQADKMASLGVLVSGVAHEINNPNNYITLSIPLLRKVWEAVSPAVERQFSGSRDFPAGADSFDEFRKNTDYLLNSIEEGALRIKGIVSDLKEYARVDSAEEKIPVDLNRVVEAAVNLIKSYIKKHTNNFQLELAEEDVLVEGQFRKLEQVVLNLIQNACDSLSDKESAVTVSTSLKENKPLLVVKDSGSGMSEEVVKKVTDPFFTTKRDSGGTGLGLSVTAGILRDHKASMEIDSNEGSGTEIRVLFTPEKA